MAGYSRYLENCKAVDEQIDWMQQRGGTLDGYVKYYNPTSAPPQAEKIYQADRAKLTRLMEIAADSAEEGIDV